MKQSTKTIVIVLAFCGVVWACHNNGKTDVASNSSGVDKVTLPSDALDSCTVTPAMFDSWFVSGKASPGGAVKPANSITFPHANNCSFYQWSHNMFLWLTSTGTQYGGTKTVLESPLFYDVMPTDSAGKRKLQQHSANIPLRMSNHLTKDGPDRLPVIIDTKGKMHEIEPQQTAPQLKAMVASSAGKINFFITVIYVGKLPNFNH